VAWAVTWLIDKSACSARTATDLRAGLRQPPLSAMPVKYLNPAIEDRAVEVLALLADRGQPTSPGSRSSVCGPIDAGLPGQSAHSGLTKQRPQLPGPHPAEVMRTT
jgi:hypothetical protein